MWRDLLEQALQAIQFDTAHRDMGDKADAHRAFGIALSHSNVFHMFSCYANI